MRALLALQTMVAVHKACPFGSSSAVYSWERVGSLLNTLARRILNLALLRYVDDFFAPERLESLEHGMWCFARLVRLLMGSSALANRKLACGNTLVVLGIQMSASDAGFRSVYFSYVILPSHVLPHRLFPAKDKAEKCASTIRKALTEGKLSAGCAEKLAGRLSWATQFMFYRLGRALLRPIFDQRFSLKGKIGNTLKVALEWWLQVLSSDLCEEHPWEASKLPVVHLFVDARGSPARCSNSCKL